VLSGFAVPMSPAYHKRGGIMSIESLLLVLVVTFWLAFVLNRLQRGQRGRRTG
jgi:hypothetical protein